jgi:hypothetical protein
MRWQSKCGREGRLAQEEKEKENRRKECNGAGVKFFGLMGFGNPGRVLTHLVNTGQAGIFNESRVDHWIWSDPNGSAQIVV